LFTFPRNQRSRRAGNLDYDEPQYASAHAAREATFIRSFTDDVTLLSWDGATDLDAAQRAGLWRSGIMVIDGAVASARMLHDKLVLTTDRGELAFDAVYPTLGAKVTSGIAQGLGARVNGDGYLLVDEHQRTNVPGLYAVGDVVAGLNQIRPGDGTGRDSRYRAAQQPVRRITARTSARTPRSRLWMSSSDGATPQGS